MSEYQTVAPRLQSKDQPNQDEKIRNRNISIAVVAAWSIATAVLTRAGVFQAGTQPPLALLLSFVVPVVGFIGLYAGSKKFSRAVGNWSLRFLTLSQTTRIAGFLFLAYWALGLLPAEFAIAAGVGDIIAGSTAPLAALYIARITLRRKIVFAAWTFYGMGDLFNAIFLGTISSAAFTHIFHILPTSNPAIVQLPIGLIPTFAVPLLMILEILAILRIRRLHGP